MKKLLALALSVMLLLSVAVCAQAMETTGAAAPSPAQAPREGLNKDIYVDREWSILNAKHDREVTITMWIPNSATSTMGTAIQALADRFNAEQLEKYPGKNITVVVEFQNKSGTLNEKLQAAILAGNNPVISAIGVSALRGQGAGSASGVHLCAAAAAVPGHDAVFPLQRQVHAQPLLPQRQQHHHLQ